MNDESLLYANFFAVFCLAINGLHNLMKLFMRKLVLFFFGGGGGGGGGN